MSDIQPDAIITLTDEEGVEHEFQVLDMLEFEKKIYAILQPADSNDDEAIILRVEEEEDGTETLVTIESDEEWENVAEAYDTLLFEEMSEESPE